MNFVKSIKLYRKSLFKKNPKMVYVLGWHGHNNLGDEAIYGSICNLFNDFSIVDFIKGSESKWAAKKISQVDRAILGGGTTIGYKLSNINTLKYCFDLCSKTMVFGAGVGELEGWIEKTKENLTDSLRHERDMIWKTLLERCVYAGVRGPLSLSALEKKGIGNIEVIGDPVISLADSTPSKRINSGKTLGINLILQKDMRGDVEQISEKMVSYIEYAKSKKWKIIWFVVNPSDLHITEEIANKTQTQENIFKIYRDYEKFKEVIKICDVFVGTRLHSVVLAISSFIPSIMLDYKPKCLDFMASIDQEEFAIRTDRINVPELYELTENMMNNRNRIVEKLVDTVLKIKKRQFEKAGELSSFPLKS